MIWQRFCPWMRLAEGSQAPPQHRAVSGESRGSTGQNTAAFRLEERENRALRHSAVVLVGLMPRGGWQEGEHVCSCPTTPRGTPRGLAATPYMSPHLPPAPLSQVPTHRFIDKMLKAHRG